MSKSYSNKALPQGTVLREWRLEEVLGVGGFGIVYKGRGIYFDELVAIKEYFPSAISDRDAGDTVVPIDSDAEEVHALGLKKFVEEAKLLWNLSTPTRHPNIVSVRALFEIHGTAYMVMDFEDGLSLSKLLRDGRRFNEASLRNLIVPIAQGLERAHRVGVLHRDIKPPNILVNDDGRPVLIDFGSARFESGDATSTKVTFHTPPYAAIEQYVRTFAQGPWTDVYALGVVLYECVTGEKPPEVLERMHGGLGKPLAEGNWPGYSETFLQAIDAAMTIRPDERPQSISQWLGMFDGSGAAPPGPLSAEDDDDRTQFAKIVTSAREILPVAPAAPGFKADGKVETPVPEDPSEVEFKRAGHDTNATRADQLQPAIAGKAAVPAPSGPALPEPPAPQTPVQQASGKEPHPLSPAPAPTKPAKQQKKTDAAKPGRSRKLPLVFGAAALAIAAAGGGWLWQRNQGPRTDPELQGLAAAPQPIGAPVDGLAVDAPSDAPSEAPSALPTGGDALAQAIRGLAGEAPRRGAPAAAVAALSAAGSRLSELYAGIDTLEGEELAARNTEMAGVARSASAAFAGALARDVEARSQKLARDQRWADPRSASSGAGQSPQRRAVAQNLSQARAQVLGSAAAAQGAGQPGEAIAAARRGLHALNAFVSAAALAYRPDSPQARPSAIAVAPTASATPTLAPAPTASARPAVAAVAGISPGKLQQFNASVASARTLAAQVIRMGQVSRPGSNASDDAKDRYKTLDQGKKAAQNYLKYLDGLSRSLSRARNDAEADRFIAQAEQTRRYLGEMQARSAAAQ